MEFELKLKSAEDKDKVILEGFMRIHGGEVKFSFPVTLEEFLVLLTQARDSAKGFIEQAKAAANESEKEKSA